MRRNIRQTYPMACKAYAIPMVFQDAVIFYASIPLNYVLNRNLTKVDYNLTIFVP